MKTKQTNESTALKPCPFCGGKAFLSSRTQKYPMDCFKIYSVVCCSCGVETAWHTVPARVAAFWNSRASERLSGEVSSDGQ